MLLSTKGIVFRSIKYSETSFITDIYTEKKGLQSFIISGVRKAKSKTSAGLFQPSSLLDLEAYYHDNKKMHRIKEVRAAYPFVDIPFSIKKTAVSIFMAELCSKSIKEAEPNTAVFQFVWTSFLFLDQTQGTISSLPISFMCNLTKHLGFTPNIPKEKTLYFDLKNGIFCDHPEEMPKTISNYVIDILRNYFTCRLDQAHTVNSNKIERKEILDILTQYYSYHLNSFEKLNSPVVYEAIF